MKALAIDSVSTCLTITAKNGELTASMTLDVGIHQAEYIITMIENVLRETSLSVKDLEFCVLCSGPGSFTGLRLGFSALKALETVSKCPIYGIETMEAYAKDFLFWQGILIPVLDARRDRFYLSIYEDGILKEDKLDIDLKAILSKIDITKPILTVGPGSTLLTKQILEINPSAKINYVPLSYNCCSSLLEIGETMFKNNEKSIEAYEGPIYIRNEHGD